MPFTPGAPISRSLWVIFIGERGAWTHAVLPVDDSLGLPDDEHLRGFRGRAGVLPQQQIQVVQVGLGGLADHGQVGVDGPSSCSDHVQLDCLQDM